MRFMRQTMFVRHNALMSACKSIRPRPAHFSFNSFVLLWRHATLSSLLLTVQALQQLVTMVIVVRENICASTLR